MQKPYILITGANGEMGHGLISALSKKNNFNIITLDLNEIDSSIKKFCSKIYTGSILDDKLINKLNTKYQFKTIYHLAALLSTKAELNPELAHKINVEGTINILMLAINQSKKQTNSIQFFFPSSIAVYGLKNLGEKNKVGSIKEDKYNNPYTMYGCNKLYCEHLGKYYSKKNINDNIQKACIDFRSIRFPGIISSKTLPTGGTSDYIPEMLHSAANGKPYECFVNKKTQIPFMTMPDAIQAIIKFMDTPKNKLNRSIYNIRAFAPTAEEFRKKLIEVFPNTEITYNINTKRQQMIDGWPKDTDDSAAKLDWNWKATHDLNRGLNNYLIPDLKNI